MAEEVNLGRLVAEIALDNSELKDDAEESIETIKNVQTASEQAETELNVNVSVSGVSNAISEIESIPDDNIRVNTEVSLEGADEAANSISNIPSDPIDINISVTGADSAIRDIEDVLQAADRLDTNVSVDINTDRASHSMNSLNQEVRNTNDRINNDTPVYKVVTKDDALENIRLILSDIGVDAEKANNIINNSFSNTSNVEAYLLKMEAVSNRMEAYQNRLRELERADNEARQTWNEMNSSTNGNMEYVSQYSNEIQSLTGRLRQQEVQYDLIQNSLDNYVHRAVDLYDAQAEREQRATENTRNHDKAITNLDASFTAAGHAADALEEAFPDISPYITAFRGITSSIKESIDMAKSGASTGLIVGNVAVGIISAVISAVISLRNQYAQAQEESRQNAYQAAQEREQESSEIRDIADKYRDLSEQLNSFNLTREKEIDIRNQLSLIQDDIINKYGVEAEQIDLNNKSIEENIRLLQEQAVAEARRYVNKNYSEYTKAKDALSQDYYVVVSGGAGGDPTEQRWYQYKYEQYIKNHPEYESEAKDSFKIKTTLENAEEVYDDFLKYMQDAAEKEGYDWEHFSYERIKASEAWNDMNSEAFQQNKAITEEYEKNLEIINQLGKNLVPDIDQYEQVLSLVNSFNSSISDLSSAYKALADGESLSVDTLTELMDKYPELAEYIQDTGDLTLDSGNKIKEVYSRQRQEIINALNSEIIDLKLLGETTEENQERISILTAILDIYKNELSDIDYNLQIENIDAYNRKLEELNESLEEYKSQCSDLKDSMSELVGIEQQLADGQALDANTVLDLIDKYPELANELSNAAGNANLQKAAIENLFEAKKSDYILTQQSAIDNIKASNNETEAVIENTKKKINIFMSAYRAADILLGGFISAGISAAGVAELAPLQTALDKGKADLQAAENRLKIAQGIDINSFKNSSKASGGVKSTGKTPLEKELEQLQHRKNLGQLTSKQEYESLAKIKNQYAKTADEKMDMDERIYSAKKQYEQDLAEQQEKNVQAEYDRIDKLSEQGKINTRQEIAQLEKIYQKYRLTAEQKITLEEKLAEKKKQLKDEEISALDTLGDAVVTALKNKYEQQKELEEKRIEESIESWKKWENETCESIQGQIDALDELKDAHDEENQRQEYENKRQALELQLAYEKDDYNRKQIQKEIAALDKDENERLFNLQIEQQKKALQEQMDNIREISQNNQDSLGEKKDTIGEKYDKLTSDFALKAEAQKTIINSSQKQLINLINSYAPEYEMAGSGLGEALYRGMTKKTGDITAYVSAIQKVVDYETAKEKSRSASELERYTAGSNSRKAQISSISVSKSSQVKSVQLSIDKLALSIDNLFNRLSSKAASYKNQMAVTANAAADRYYSTQRYYTESTQNKVSSPTNVYMTVNFNDKVDSPVEVKRQLEYVSEQLARQISG